MGESGGSAERKAADLAAAGECSAGAWAAGAEGERRVAAELAGLGEGWTVLHDRLLRPGRSEANLDHIVVGPAGVFLIDAKNRSGTVTEWEGGLYQHVLRDGAAQHLSMAEELRKVHGMAAYMAVESDAPVRPVLCLAGRHEASFGTARPVRGVWVVPVSQLVAWLQARPLQLDPGRVARLVTRTMTDFPSTTTDPELLAALGRSATLRDDTRRRRRPAARPPVRTLRTPGPRAGSRRSGRRAGSLVARLAVVALMLAAVPVVLPRLTALVTDLLDRAVSVPRVVLPSAAATTASPSAGTGRSPARVLRDCSYLTARQVGSIVGRVLQPVATSDGCAWGRRLDDPATTVVMVRLEPSHAAYESQLVTSASQHRVVYGTSIDATYHPATALWVATGQPIGTGAGRATALADTEVVVATATLKVTDDTGRAMALAVAKAVNSVR